MAKRKTPFDRFFAYFEKVEFVRSIFDWGGLAKPILSFLVAVMAIAAGIMEGVPFIVLITGTVLTFAGVMMALNEFDGWQDRNALQYKMIFVQAIVHCIVNKEQYANTKLASFQPAAIFKNTGKKDLWYRVENFHAVVQGQSVAHPHFDSRGGMIAADHVTEYRYAAVPNVNCSILPIEGVLAYTIRFGRSQERLNFALKEKWRFELFRSNPDDDSPPTQIKVTRIEFDEDE